MVPNTGVLSRMKFVMVLGALILLKKIMGSQCQIFGHVARGSPGKELRECIRSSDRKIGRGRRKISLIDSLRDDWREGNRKEHEISRKKIGMEEKNQRF